MCLAGDVGGRFCDGELGGGDPGPVRSKPAATPVLKATACAGARRGDQPERLVVSRFEKVGGHKR